MSLSKIPGIRSRHRQTTKQRRQSDAGGAARNPSHHFPSHRYPPSGGKCHFPTTPPYRVWRVWRVGILPIRYPANSAEGVLRSRFRAWKRRPPPTAQQRCRAWSTRRPASSSGASPATGASAVAEVCPKAGLLQGVECLVPTTPPTAPAGVHRIHQIVLVGRLAPSPTGSDTPDRRSGPRGTRRVHPRAQPPADDISCCPGGPIRPGTSSCCSQLNLQLPEQTTLRTSP